MHRQNKTYKSRIKPTIVGVALVILISAGVTGYLLFFQNTKSTNSNQKTETSQPIINLNPPTIDEQQAGNTQKQKNVSREQVVNTPSTAEVVIVDATQYGSEIEVRAFVANIISDGACTITFNKDSESFEKQVQAYADASSSPCTTLIVPRSEFSSAGQWQVTVLYTSPSLNGSVQGILEVK